ncbi:MAG: DsrE family protein [Croceitalea sp.]|nr:DsrE family protein [Croceitalea sp.]NNC35285.1 DsrE family protein [Croceitalea sp.]NNL09345.1 DsrE family protein [Croceitalea sp.]
MKYFLQALFAIVIVQGAAWCQTKKAGPIIPDYGEVWSIDNPDYKIIKDMPLKVVFDIMNSPEDVSSLNKSIETAARFLNMHAQSGVAKENMHVALVVHNQASKDIIINSAYNEKYGTDNPNHDMVKQLMDAGVSFILCGQSSLSRNFPIEETIPGVQLSLSAMTALIQLQNEGYRLIKF